MKRIDTGEKTLTVRNLVAKCRYHKKDSEAYNSREYLKGFKCLELFNTIYPKVLALLYDARFTDEELTINCPNRENTVTVRLVTEPVKSLLRRGVNTAKELLWFLRPMDVVKVTVFVEVVSVFGDCYVDYKQGDRIEICYDGTMCPQTLYSLFPSVILSDDCFTAQCPSSVNKVTFRVENKC